MPFFCSKSTEKEQSKHNFYEETGMNEICSTDSHILTRFQNVGLTLTGYNHFIMATKL